MLCKNKENYNDKRMRVNGDTTENSGYLLIRKGSSRFK